jgi:hypothetical protein
MVSSLIYYPASTTHSAFHSRLASHLDLNFFSPHPQTQHNLLRPSFLGRSPGLHLIRAHHVAGLFPIFWLRQSSISPMTRFEP